MKLYTYVGYLFSGQDLLLWGLENDLIDTKSIKDSNSRIRYARAMAQNMLDENPALCGIRIQLILPDGKLGDELANVTFMFKIQKYDADDPGVGNLEERPYWFSLHEHIRKDLRFSKCALRSRLMDT